MWTDVVIRFGEMTTRSVFPTTIYWARLCASTLYTDWNSTLSDGVWQHNNHSTRHLWCISPLLLVWLHRPMETKASSCPRLRIFCCRLMTLDRRSDSSRSSNYVRQNKWNTRTFTYSPGEIQKYWARVRDVHRTLHSSFNHNLWLLTHWGQSHLNCLNARSRGF